MEKNEEYEGTVQALGSAGEGIINAEGTTVFVPFCLVGEKVRYKVLKVKGNIAYGKLLEVLTPAYARVNPPCPVFEKCGGCDLQHMDYASQLVFKRGTVERALQKIGGITADISPTVPCEKQYRYRNKLALPIGECGGVTVLGFYGPHSHRIVPGKDCLIQSEWVKSVISAVESFAKETHICGFDELSGKGVLRRIVVREIKGRFIIALVAAKNINLDAFAAELDKYFENYTLLLNVNGGQTNAIFGKEWHICRGEGFFEAEENGVKYRAGANTFLQVNDGVREKLYARILEEVEEGAAAIDLYSGGGMLTAMLAKKCTKAYGIEIVEEASRCADELKNENGLQNRMFNICGKVEDKIGEVMKMTRGLRRVIVCDPPRKGMERSVVCTIKDSGAEKVILVSCNPATLARDLGILTGTLSERDGELVKAERAQSEYAIECIIPFDMFPQTKHIETLICLKRKQPK